MKKNKKILFYFLSFLIPIAIFGIICFITKFYPFGENLLNKYDSYKMYPSLLLEYINKFRSGNSLLYTFHAALGTNFISLIHLYLGSPFNLLLLFFKNDQIYLFYSIIIFLKIGLSSLCLFIYFQNKNSNKLLVNLVFSCIYALSGFLITYNYHIMWSDAFYLTPLVLLGVDKLISNNNHILYLIFLTISIIINFYIGYMMCIFTFIYFIYRIINTDCDKKKIIIEFIKYSLIAGLISSFVLIPSAIAILNGRTISEFSLFSINIANLKSLFYNLLPASFIMTDNYNEGSCVIYCSIFVVVLTIFYFFNQKFSKKEKITVGAIILFFILSFILRPLDLTWNMFAQPVWWNSRYAFLFSLFLIIIAHKTFININYIKIKPIIKSLIIIIFILLFLTSFTLKLYGSGQKIKTFYILVSSIILFILYIYLLIKLKTKRFIIIIFVVAELTFNAYYSLKVDNVLKISDTKKEMEKVNNNLDLIKDNDFYRIYQYNDKQFDSGLFYGYNSINLFASIYNKKINDFYENKLNGGASVNHTELPLTNIETLSLLNVKYILFNNFKDNLSCLNENVCINKYSLPLGFLISSKSTIKLKNNEPLDNLNKIYSYLLNENIDLYYKPDINVKLKNVNEKNKYLIMQKGKKKGKITLEFISDFNGVIAPNRNNFFYLDECSYYLNGKKSDKTLFMNVKKGDNIKIVYNFTGARDDVKLQDLEVKILDLNKLQEISNKLSTYKLNIITNNKHLLTGSIDNKQNQKLFLSIPYDKGLIIKVDGKKTPYNMEFNTFISINVPKGKHIITIDYIPMGSKLGIILSETTFLGVLTYEMWRLICRKKKYYT